MTDTPIHGKKAGRQLKAISGNGLDISFKYNSEGIRTEKKDGDIIGLLDGSGTSIVDI